MFPPGGTSVQKPRERSPFFSNVLFLSFTPPRALGPRRFGGNAPRSCPSCPHFRDFFSGAPFSTFLFKFLPAFFGRLAPPFSHICIPPLEVGPDLRLFPQYDFVRASWKNSFHKFPPPLVFPQFFPPPRFPKHPWTPNLRGPISFCRTTGGPFSSPFLSPTLLTLSLAPIPG